MANATVATNPGASTHICSECRVYLMYLLPVLPVQVRYLKVIEKSGYQALPWVRYITCAGNYEIRFS